MSNGYGRSTEGFGVDRETSVRLIVKTALEYGITDSRQIAYMLATAQHESQDFTAPEEHYGRSQAKKLGYMGGEEFYGRGYVHLTHDYNYRLFDEKLGLNGRLINDLQLAKDPEIAAKILVVGMRDGLFTGKRLDRYINENTIDLYNARRTVNGITAKAWTIEAAQRCQEHTLAWQEITPALIEEAKMGVAFKGIPYALEAPRVLYASTKGVDVRDLQKNLNRLGFADNQGRSLTPDGEYGQSTAEAVAAFQRMHQMPANGIADVLTQNAIQVSLNPLNIARGIEQSIQPFQYQARADWLDRDVNGLSNYLRTSYMPVSTPTPRHQSGSTREPQHHPTPAPPAEPAAFPHLLITQPLEPGDRSAAVQALQQHLQLLGATDRYGQKIQADRDYGDRTREAVEQFQLWTGREPTGIADAETLRAVQAQAQFTLRQRARGISISPDAHLAERLRPAMPDLADAALERPVPGRSPLMPSSDPNPSQLPERADHGQPEAASDRPHLDTQALSTHHRDHPLFEAIRRQLPPGTSDEMAAHLMLQAKIGGVEHIGKLDEVIVQNGWAYVAGKTPGDMAAVDLSAPIPALQETLRQSAAFDQQQAVQLAQFQEQQRAINTPGGGPTMLSPGGGFGMG